ncbi:MAG: cell division protein FtsA [Alphaproteobacteria bacterium]|nr:cell division protein FtsA [Alphaproteobacteria bacterium]
MAVIRPAKFSKDSELIAAIDIGASKAVCLIARLAPSRGRTRVPEIIGVGRFGEAVGERAQANAQSAETALRGAVDAAERMAGERIRGVTAAMSGRRLACRRIGVDLDIEGGRVTQEDITDCMRQGAAAAAVDGAAPVHALPISYAIDGEDSMGDPTGLAGSTLTAEILGVSARERHVVNLEALIERCGLKLDDLVAAPLAAAEAVLVEDERELGAILLDIGARSTDFAVFERGALVACGGVPLGGEHVTRDIAHAFGAPLKDAERIKTLYGAALIGAGDENKLVNVPQLGDEDEFVKVSRAELSAVIAPRLEEIFELAAERLPSDARARHGVRRLILTGGGSLLVGAREMAERVLKMKTRLGRPAGLAGAPDAATAPQFSVCAGLIQLAVKQKAERADLAAACRPPVRATQGGLLAGVGQWLRENF